MSTEEQVNLRRLVHEGVVATDGRVLSDEEKELALAKLHKLGDVGALLVTVPPVPESVMDAVRRPLDEDR